MIDNLFDVSVDNVHMVKVDSFEATTPAPVMPTNLAPTPKQFDFLKKLFAERSQNEEAQILRIHLLSELKAGKMTRTMASEAISDILNMEKDVKAPQHLQTMDLKHGQVWVNEYGKFIKVCLNQQGTSFYGKFWDSNKLEWIYGPGSLRDLDHLVTAEEAKEFSLQWESEHRNCIFCMRHLSDARSELAGYGETCAKKYNLPWGV